VPDSVVNQYIGDNFTTNTWPDSVGNADLSVNGPTTGQINGQIASSSDGVDDIAKTTSPGPAQLPTATTFGVAFSVKGTDTTDITSWFGAVSGSAVFQLISDSGETGKKGAPLLFLRDDTGQTVERGIGFNLMDGNAHFVVINKTGSGAGSVDMYVDTVSSPEPATASVNQGFDPTSYTAPGQFGVHARADGTAGGSFKSFRSTLFEFNSEPYTKKDRKELKKRAPGI
jgi:hypothetical protein